MHQTLTRVLGHALLRSCSREKKADGSMIGWSQLAAHMLRKYGPRSLDKHSLRENESEHTITIK